MMKKILFLIFILFTGMELYAQQVEWVTTTEGKHWNVQKTTLKGNNYQLEKILDLSDTCQVILGVGGCFNEVGWDALSSLDHEKREEVLEAIFSRREANFNYCRMPIGANDFSLSYYSLDDVADDFNLVNFNIDRDRYILIPYIRAAKNINPDLKLWASPWCPPSWMKINNHYASKHCNEPDKDYNGLSNKSTIIERRTGFKMQDAYLKSYADYFVRFIKAYENEGIKIEAICPQNEPLANQVYSSCTWDSRDLAIFVGRYLGPAFEKEGIGADIYWGTINSSDPDYVRTAINDGDASKYIKGVGFQWSGKKAIGTIHKEYPEYLLMQTETECGNGQNTWKYAEYTWNLMLHYFHNGINSYHYWNMILPSENVSRWGWRQNSMVLIDKQTKEVTYTHEYYLMKHLSHYLDIGAVRINSDDNVLAFENPNGSIVIMVGNTKDETVKFNLGLRGKCLDVDLMPHSINTFYVK